MQDQVFELLLEKEDVSWKTILQELVATEQMDPWDVNITLLTNKYIETVKEMQEHNLRVSGKVLLAAAFLLKIKSAHFIDHDISNLDRLISSTEDDADEDEFFEEINGAKRVREKFQLIPKNPQPRTRKVSINDLIQSLQRALASKRRVLARQKPVKFIMPKAGVDIIEVIRDVYHKIVYYTEKDKKMKLSFSKLLPPKAGKHEKVFTFVPLLHLENQKKVETSQKEPFDEIYVKLMKKAKI
jgi:segregation and condensation protein A